MPIRFYDSKVPDEGLSNIKKKLKEQFGADERNIHISFGRGVAIYTIYAVVRVNDKFMGEYAFDEKHTMLGDNDEQIINAIAEMIPSPN